jgi:hypothetical protein
MFSGWQAFYQTTGGAAATLTGLLFLVVSLMAGRPMSASSAGQRLFTTPTVFHLASVLVISALALAPIGEGDLQSAAVTLWAFAGLIYALTRATGILGLSSQTNWSDFWWYGFGPTIAYLALSAAAAATWAHASHAVYLVALCLVALLVVAIRNAWDLVTWLAPRRDPESGPPA